MKNILVTGINGFVGYRLGQVLAKQGYNVVGIVRDIHRGQKIDFADVVYGNIIKPEVIHRAIADYDIDSVPNYSPIIVKDGAGIVDIMSIEDFWYKINSPVITDGKREIKKVNEYWILTKGRNWSKIKYIGRHLYSGNIVRIIAHCGAIDVTPNHSIPMRTNPKKGGKYIHNASNAREGLYVGIPKIESFGGNHGARNRYFAGTKNLAWLFGLFTADGTAYKCKNKKGGMSYGVSIDNSNEKIINRVKHIMKRELNIDPFTVEWKTKNGTIMYTLTVNNIRLYNFFRENFYTIQGDKKVPQSILNAPNHIKYAFLQGYNSGDGSKLKDRDFFIFTTKSQTLGLCLVWLLITLNRTYSLQGYVDDRRSFFQIAINKGKENIKPRGLIKKIFNLYYSGYVYDIETGTHKFTTGIGPIIVHNTIFHLAAQSIVSRAEKNPIETFKVNIIGTANILEACRQFNIKCLFTSTDKVYGPAISASETNPLVPTNIYATSKVTADLVAQMYMKNYAEQVIITRACNIYGPGDTNPRIIPNTIRACLRNKKPVIFTDIKGEREYIYIDDVVEAYITLAKTQKRGIFNIGTGIVRSQTEVVFAILKYFPNLEPRYTRKGSVELIPSQSLDSTKIHRLNWHHKVSFDEGIKRTIVWWKNKESSNVFKKYL